MCQAIREMIEEGREEGREEGLDLAKKIFRFYRDGKSNEEIANECNISVAKVAEILS